MAQLTVTIPDNKIGVFVELMKSTSYVKSVERVDESGVPDWHKTVLDARMETYKSNPHDFTEWEAFDTEMKSRYGL